MLSCLLLFLIPWTVVRQAPLTMGFSRQEYWNGLPFPPPGDLPNPGMEPGSPTPPVSPALQADSLSTEPSGKPPYGKGGGGGGLVDKSCLTLATPLTVAYQAPLSMSFYRQEYWSGLPFPFRLNLIVRLDDFKNTFVSLF